MSAPNLKHFDLVNTNRQPNMESKEKSALIGNIQRFCIHDGDGVRTTIFLKGCPLKCYWCANPEDQSYERELMYFQNKCQRCHACLSICPVHALSTDAEGFVSVDRKLCKRCFECTCVCLDEALTVAGKHYYANDVFQKAFRDKVFYRTHGGVTISGGEPLAFPEFCMEFASLCRKQELNVIFETCGFGKWLDLQAYAKYAQGIFFDIKHSNSAKHRRATGVRNETIIENFSRITHEYERVTVRIPVIPGLNDTDEEMRDIASMLKRNMGKKEIRYVELMPFHNLGMQKYVALDFPYALQCHKNFKKDEVRKFLVHFERAGIPVTVK